MAKLPGVDLGTPAGALLACLWPIPEPEAQEARSSWAPALCCPGERKALFLLPCQEQGLPPPWTPGPARPLSGLLREAAGSHQHNGRRRNMQGAQHLWSPFPVTHTLEYLGASGQGRPFLAALMVQPGKDGCCVSHPSQHTCCPISPHPPHPVHLGRDVRLL